MVFTSAHRAPDDPRAFALCTLALGYTGSCFSLSFISSHLEHLGCILQSKTQL